MMNPDVRFFLSALNEGKDVGELIAVHNAFPETGGFRLTAIFSGEGNPKAVLDFAPRDNGGRLVAELFGQHARASIRRIDNKKLEVDFELPETIAAIAAVALDLPVPRQVRLDLRLSDLDEAIEGTHESKGRINLLLTGKYAGKEITIWLQVVTLGEGAERCREVRTEFDLSVDIGEKTFTLAGHGSYGLRVGGTILSEFGEEDDDVKATASAELEGVFTPEDFENGAVDPGADLDPKFQNWP